MSDLSRDVILDLWDWFLARWTQRWAATRKQAVEQMGEDHFIDVWLRDLEGLSPEDLARGFQKTRHLDWPPGSGEFRRYCLFTPEDGGFPLARAAYEEAIEQIGRMAVMRQWSCEVIRQTAEAMASALRYGGEQVFEQFQERYTKKCFSLHRGVPEKTLVVNTQPEAPLTREQAELVARGRAVGLEWRGDDWSFFRQMIERLELGASLPQLRRREASKGEGNG